MNNLNPKLSRKRHRQEKVFDISQAVESKSARGASEIKIGGKYELCASESIPFAKQDNREIAPSLEEYLAPGGFIVYRPREEWCRDPSLTDLPLSTSTSVTTSRKQTNSNKSHPRTFQGLFPTRAKTKTSMNFSPSLSSLGNSALHKAILEFNTAAALDLLAHGAPTNCISTHRHYKGVTPLSTASHLGDLIVVKALLQNGANPHLQNKSGSTALIQASHFGHTSVVKCLLEFGANVNQSNDKQTTPLMRAAQEGHHEIVKVLLQHNADVNSQNNEQMTSLLLASQRGHARIVKTLLQSGADSNQRTKQKATCLMLACKRGHVQVVRTLLANGAEIELKDCKGRTAKDAVKKVLVHFEAANAVDKAYNYEKRKKELKLIIDMLTYEGQIALMKQETRVERNYMFTKIYSLMQLQRAEISIKDGNKITVIKSCDIFSTVTPRNIKRITKNRSTQALLLTMTLPAFLMEHIAALVPFPPLYSTCFFYLQRKTELPEDELPMVNDIIPHAFDLIEELLEKGSFLKLCDSLHIPPPSSFKSWVNWSSWGRICDGVIAIDNDTSKKKRAPSDRCSSKTSCHQIQSTKEMRKHHPFLCVLSDEKFTSSLKDSLTTPPYSMDTDLFDNLIKYADVVKLIRNLVVGCYFDMRVATEVVQLAGKVLQWLTNITKQDSDGIVL